MDPLTRIAANTAAAASRPRSEVFDYYWCMDRSTTASKDRLGRRETCAGFIAPANCLCCWAS